MNFNSHSGLAGQHAFLGASKYHWTNYSDEKIDEAFTKFMAVQKGTELHALACDMIRLKIKLPKSKKSLNEFVNDAIGFRMHPEQTLYYSPNSFGTTDAICFRDNFLRIHDLKTGLSATSIRQLEVYAALFCLEYRFDPNKIQIELRIYQNDEILIHNPTGNDIFEIMEKIVRFDKRIDQRKLEMED